MRILLAFLLILSCANVVHAQALNTLTTQVVSEIDQEVTQLRTNMKSYLGVRFQRNPSDDAWWVSTARNMVISQGKPIDLPGLMVVVDRNPKVQRMVVIMAREDHEWDVIGGASVSTGQAGRPGYFINPTGVFQNTSVILGYRAEGTYNENHIRGLGVRGMRVWDFGWQTTQRGWKAGEADIRLSMHATDPDVLEARLGRTASEGCVRLPHEMNKFLDHYGVIDADQEEAAKTDKRFAELLPSNREPSRFAGNALVVVDSTLR